MEILLIILGVVCAFIIGYYTGIVHLRNKLLRSVDNMTNEFMKNLEEIEKEINDQINAPRKETEEKYNRNLDDAVKEHFNKTGKNN